jgi:hypothetical protein
MHILSLLCCPSTLLYTYIYICVPMQDPRYHPFFFRRNSRVTPPILRNITVTRLAGKDEGVKLALSVCLSLERGGYKNGYNNSFRV